MLTIRLNCLGYFTQDINVNVIPPIGATINFDGVNDDKRIVLQGRVDTVHYTIGRYAYDAIVTASCREVNKCE